MRICLLSLICIFIIAEASSQSSQSNDFIVLKKRNNRTLKTYGEGSFLSASTNTGFQLNGFIKAIRNDSIFITQQETKLVATEFGQKIDTMFHTFGFDYHNITSFYFQRQYDGVMRKRGFSQTTLPALLILGGSGFVVLELVNTLYRKEKLNDSGKLLSLGIAAGVAGTGVLLQTLNSRKNKVGNKYKVYYIKNPHVK
ncbi:MAG TPA: hypothetical protein VK625_06480 [Flavitalea sp.]|nr:hypothetical protein [Flavitalea sp.]